MDLVLSVVIVIAVQLVGFLFLRGRIHQELNTTSLLKDVQSEVDEMVRELNLSAERNIGLLEARIEELEGLLAQADQKLVLLAREVDRREKTAEVYSQLRRSQVAEAEPEPAPEVVVPTPRDQPVLPFAAEPEPVFELKAAPEPEKSRSLKERVLAHRDQGLEPAAIAAVTGATRGEVELILSLNPVSPRG
jgi:hypothetical protein